MRHIQQQIQPFLTILDNAFIEEIGKMKTVDEKLNLAMQRL